MAIISISINEKLLEDMEKLQNEQGFSGRSEIIRSGLRNLIADAKEKSKLKGNIDGVIIVVNLEKYNDEISKIRHDYNDIIKTQIHNHLEGHKCLQIFVINGNADKVVKFMDELQVSKKIEYQKLYVS